MMIMNINKIPIYHTYMPLELQEGCQKKTNIKKNFLKKNYIKVYSCTVCDSNLQVYCNTYLEWIKFFIIFVSPFLPQTHFRVLCRRKNLIEIHYLLLR